MGGGGGNCQVTGAGAGGPLPGGPPIVFQKHGNSFGGGSQDGGLWSSENASAAPQSVTGGMDSGEYPVSKYWGRIGQVVFPSLEKVKKKANGPSRLMDIRQQDSQGTYISNVSMHLLEQAIDPGPQKDLA